MAAVIGADKKEIIFTSGATESNNLAIKGVADFYKEKKRHIITTQIVSFYSLTYLGTQMYFKCLQNFRSQ